MDKKGFVQRLKEQKKTQTTINRYVDCTEALESFLEKNHKNPIENAIPGDLEEFRSWAESRNLKLLAMHFRGIAGYFKYLAKEQLALKAYEIVGDLEFKKFKIGDFQGVKKAEIRALRKIKIQTASQLLEKGFSKKGRELLAKQTGLPVGDIVELVKLSELSRIPGVKKVRARLYVDSGLDTLQKIAATGVDELRNTSTAFIRESDFQGVPPTQQEAEHTVIMAQYLEQKLEL